MGEVSRSALHAGPGFVPQAPGAQCEAVGDTPPSEIQFFRGKGNIHLLRMEVLEGNKSGEVTGEVNFE